MAANMNVTYDEMVDAAGKMRVNRQTIDEKLTECKSIVEMLTGSGFVTDQASKEYDLTVGEFVSSATTVMESLGQLSEWLDKAVEALKNMDTELTNSLKQG